jgi:SsrA-binding protein
MTAATEEKVLATNRAAFHDYHISTKYEAGAALTGTEVKSVLGGRIQLKDSYVGVREGEAWLFNAHISPYSHGNRENHDPLRTRKLLLHRKEIDKLDQVAADARNDAGSHSRLHQRAAKLSLKLASRRARSFMTSARPNCVVSLIAKRARN